MRWLAVAVAIFALTLLLPLLFTVTKPLAIIAYVLMLIAAIIAVLKPSASS
ncbi:MAG: hypothetical protein HYY32_03990 [Chloroflexi bacterium]|nr:hypothetical protein [Chloroflexota bacterium]